MKRTGTLMFAMLLAISSIGQSTTETEYNYISQGLKTTEAQGLDLKAGYAFADTVEVTFKGLIITVRTLIRTRNKTIAGTSLKITEGQGKSYFCLPAGNTSDAESYGWDLYFKQTNNTSWQYKEAIAFITTKMYSYYRDRFNAQSKRR